MLQPDQQSVVDEKNDLDIKLNSLSEFVSSSIFKSLDELDKDLLIDQLNHMVRYSHILGLRIVRF